MPTRGAVVRAEYKNQYWFIRNRAISAPETLWRDRLVFNKTRQITAVLLVMQSARLTGLEKQAGGY